MPSRPDDQRLDDSKSLVFDSGPLTADREILGYPLAKIRVSANVAVAKLALRLTEVLPDGTSWLVSYGILNLTHRSSHAHPAALTPGEFYDVEVPLYMVAHRFKQGSRIRAAVSESLWPLVWPSPQIATLTIDLSASSLMLPLRHAPAHEAPFPIPVIHSSGSSRYTHTDIGPGTEAHLLSPPRGDLIPEVGTLLTTQAREDLTIKEGEPNSGMWAQQNSTTWKRGDWDCTVSAAYELTSTPEQFRVKEVLHAKKGDQEIFKREQISTIKRELL
jgi:hypothetical protein